ncbi:MAG: hypothetical protein AAB736_00780 [Patescibacteria group bacterium]
MQKLINFIKYNNAFTIGIAAFLLVAGSSFASETVRDTVIGKTIEEVKGMDNSALLSASLDSLKSPATPQVVQEHSNSNSFDVLNPIISLG